MERKKSCLIIIECYRRRNVVHLLRVRMLIRRLDRELKNYRCGFEIYAEQLTWTLGAL
jgi:hypothetical protein